MSEQIDWSKAPEDPKTNLMRLIISLSEYMDDGRLIWSERVGKKDRAGLVVGSVNSSDGYRYAKCKGEKVGVHRVVFFMHHGYCPPEIDHINRKRDDNRIENLRDPVSHTNNLGNQSHQIGRSSRFKGVCWDKNRGKWSAAIKDDGKAVFLGRFSDEASAAIAYNNAATLKFGKYAHLNEVQNG